jgi:hypothetical protein
MTDGPTTPSQEDPRSTVKIRDQSQTTLWAANGTLAHRRTTPQDHRTLAGICRTTPGARVQITGTAVAPLHTEILAESSDRAD